MKIAMWSGPRNLSTAMMYAFVNRADTQVVDEPFYGAYLHYSNADHPMRAEIMASMACDPVQVSAELSGPVPGDVAIWYQKHMTHHMLEHFSMDLLANLSNVFLIRDPARVIASYAAKREEPTLDDIGYVQQSREEMEVLFTFLSERYERRSLIITSNLVFSEWDKIFKDPLTTAAAIDRVIHHSVIIEFGREIKSMRMEAAAKRLKRTS